MPEEPTKKKWWKRLLEEMGVAALGDAAVLGIILPWIKTKMSGKPITEEEKIILAKAHGHYKAGERDKAVEELNRLPFGIGKFDEQQFDEDCLKAQKPPNNVPADRIRDLERWLADDKDRRTKFRNSLTLRKEQSERVALIAEYAGLNDWQRNTKLVAVGKMDPEEAEEFLYGLAEILAARIGDFNVWLQQALQRRRRGWFSWLAEKLIG